MAQIVEIIDVDVPVSTSYNQWTQFEEFPKFLTSVKSVTQQDDTHSHWVVNIAGSERSFDTVVSEQHPDERVAWTSTGGQVNHAGVVTFHKLSDTSSRVAVQIDWDPDGAVEKAGAALNIPDRVVKSALADFKKFIEEQGSADGAWRGTVDN